MIVRMKDNNLKVAGVYFNRYEAEMAKGLLDGANIPCVVKGDDGGGMWPNLSMGMGNYRLWVDESNLALAKDILATVASVDQIIGKPRKKGFWVAGLIFLMVVIVLIGGMTGKNWLQFRNPFLKLYRSISFVQANVSCEVPSGSPSYVEVCREFYNNGATYSETFYHNRQNHGPSTVYYPDGTFKWAGNYVDGLLEGRAYEYYPSGKVRFEFNYSKDELNGTVLEYFENGAIKAQYPYMENLLHGVQTTYYSSGNLADESEYKNGLLMDKNGRLFSGKKKLFYENGKPWMESMHKEGLLYGMFKEYDENGQIIILSEFKDNQMNGPSKEFYSDGRLKSELFYQKDVLQRIREYDNQGRIIYERDYQ